LVRAVLVSEVSACDERDTHRPKVIAAGDREGGKLLLPVRFRVALDGECGCRKAARRGNNTGESSGDDRGPALEPLHNCAMERVDHGIAGILLVRQAVTGNEDVVSTE